MTLDLVIALAALVIGSVAGVMACFPRRWRP
jgi:hypothetical protein